MFKEIVKNAWHLVILYCRNLLNKKCYYHKTQILVSIFMLPFESFDDGKILIENFNPESESLTLRGGQSLTLKSSQHLVMPVPSAQPVKKKTSPVVPAKSPIRLPKPGLPRVKIPARNASGSSRP